MTKTSFDEFVKRQQSNASGDDVPGIDRDKQRDEWLAYLDQLYKQIELFLTDYTAAGQLQHEYHDIPLNEDYIGSYSARQLALKIGRQVVTFTPIGTSLFGAKGRVDVQGPAGQVRLLLLNKTAKNARQLIQVRIGFDAPPPPRLEPSAEEIASIQWVWKIATPPPEITFIDLTQDAFFDMMLGVVGA